VKSSKEAISSPGHLTGMDRISSRVKGQGSSPRGIPRIPAPDEDEQRPFRAGRDRPGRCIPSRRRKDLQRERLDHQVERFLPIRRRLEGVRHSVGDRGTRESATGRGDRGGRDIEGRDSEPLGGQPLRVVTVPASNDQSS
jgi:hypothetical protein